MHIVANNSEFDIDENTALLPALQQHGVCAQLSCRNGSCGLCEATLNAGGVWLDDKCQSVTAPASILLCRAFARSDIALSVDIAPRAVSRYCRVLRFEKIEDGYEIELRLPAGRIPALLPTDAVRLVGSVGARLLSPVFVPTPGRPRTLTLALGGDDKEWLDAISAGDGLHIMLPVTTSQG